MRKIGYFIGLCFLLSGLAVPSLAADVAKLNDDLVYRASLGTQGDINLLLKQGADANARNKDGVPALALAAARKDSAGLDVVKALIAHGATVEQPDANGQTALFYAARIGQKDMVTYLLEQKANYYTIDNKGDVARNIAFREGHQDIVDLMDNFVKTQSQQVMQQYLDYNKIVQQRYKEIQDSANQPPPVDPNVAEPPPVAVPQTPSRPPMQQASATVAAGDAPAPGVTPTPAKPYDEARLRELVTQLSSSSCAFQYWSFCRDVRQHTELSADALDDAIEDERKQITTTGALLIAEFEVSATYVNHIIDPSKKQVYDQLNKMGWNGFRRENGVGSKSDMLKRCNRIANNWQITPPGSKDALDIDAITPGVGDPKDTNKPAQAPKGGYSPFSKNKNLGGASN